MASYCRVVVLGNIVRDLEVKFLQSGTAVCDMSIAVNDRVKRGDSYEDQVSFFDVTLFGKSAEIASEYLGKGSQCLIDGRLKQETWDAADGTKRSKLKVIGEKLILLGKKGEGGSGESKPEQKGADDETLPW